MPLPPQERPLVDPHAGDVHRKQGRGSTRSQLLLRHHAREQPVTTAVQSVPTGSEAAVQPPVALPRAPERCQCCDRIFSPGPVQSS
ncbi:hypothetical protein NDU88_006970 [Pleurodeles waltl]|uniref:Uncharacterized protein n=1 Tax=Pleurodeles waltl TaxID=8319 RepID=A0AAV7MEE1_PLEWA|nr:hypothetical protein NDU88_006970 [Pleurodeles waltl]